MGTSCKLFSNDIHCIVRCSSNSIRYCFGNFTWQSKCDSGLILIPEHCFFFCSGHFNWSLVYFFYLHLDSKRRHDIYPLHFMGFDLCAGQNIPNAFSYNWITFMHFHFCDLLLCHRYLFTVDCPWNQRQKLRWDSNHFERKIRKNPLKCSIWS